MLISLIATFYLLLATCLRQSVAFVPQLCRSLIRQPNVQLHENPVRFAGTGARTADMNQYNLPLDVIEEQWKASVIPKTIESDGGIFLGVKDDVNLFVDVIQVVVPRPTDCGLGIELQEVAGGRGDGLGITLVSGVVKDGWISKHCTDGDIQLGDSITSLSVVQRRGRPGSSGILSDTEETIKAQTECLGYDATVDAIMNLPQPLNQDEKIIIGLKRLRRKPKIKVNLRYPPSQNEPDAAIELFAGENLRLGMLARGVKLNDPLAQRFDTKSSGNCGAGGLCRTCAVGVLRGGNLLSPQKVAESQMLEDEPRWRLACKSFVGYGMEEGAITVQVNPRQW